MTDILDDPYRGREMQSVETVHDLLMAAKYANPRLSRFVLNHRSFVTIAQRLLRVGIENPDTNAAVRLTHELTDTRLAAALVAAERELQQSDNHPGAISKAECDALAQRVAVYAQVHLDALRPSEYWAPEKHIELERDLYAHLIAPLVDGGTILRGCISVGLGDHPKTKKHHSLVVGRVTLEAF